MRPALTKTLISCLWYRWGRSSTYLHIPFLWWEEAQPKNLHVDFYIFTALLPQSMLDDDLFVVFWSLVLSTFDIFRETYTLFAKYSHEIYFKSNYSGLVARYRTQFLMDLFKDPILPSVILMVTPTRCHRATGGNPFQGECRLIGLRNWQF